MLLSKAQMIEFSAMPSIKNRVVKLQNKCRLRNYEKRTLYLVILTTNLFIFYIMNFGFNIFIERLYDTNKFIFNMTLFFIIFVVDLF